MRACRTWRAATRASSWRSATRPSAATGATIPFAGEIRLGEVAVELVPEELGFADHDRRDRGHRVPDGEPVQGLGRRRRRSSRAATAWPSATPSARRWRWRWSTGRSARRELGETPVAPAQDEEFVLYHGDNVEASGFVQHLKLPHYVDFQSELVLLARRCARRPEAGADEPTTTSRSSTSRPSG